MSGLPHTVTIVEVGPRDGLQNESLSIATNAKVAFIRKLADAGLRQIEAASFVNPQVIPQLADAEQVWSALPSDSPVVYSALVPNLRGLERAAAAGVKRIAVFTAASETFTQKNIGMTIAQSLDVFREVVRRALHQGISVRGYVSTSFGCPYEGSVDPQVVVRVSNSLLQMGADQIAISDTIGAAVPTNVLEIMRLLLRTIPVDKFALHLHDTHGTALANVYAGLTVGVSVFDSSAGGLGGCPFAPGAAGNLATEDLVYFLDRMGIASGVDGKKVLEAAAVVSAALGHPLQSAQWRRCKTSV